jgi:hypothetical protein
VEIPPLFPTRPLPLADASSHPPLVQLINNTHNVRPLPQPRTSRARSGRRGGGGTTPDPAGVRDGQLTAATPRARVACHLLLARHRLCGWVSRREEELTPGPALVFGVPPIRKSMGWKPAERVPTTFPSEFSVGTGTREGKVVDAGSGGGGGRGGRRMVAVGREGRSGGCGAEGGGRWWRTMVEEGGDRGRVWRRRHAWPRRVLAAEELSWRSGAATAMWSPHLSSGISALRSSLPKLSTLRFH